MREQPIVFQAFQDTVTGTLQVVATPGQFHQDPPANVPVNTDDQATRFVVPDDADAGFQWAPWGNLDCLPSTIRQKIELVPMAGQAVYRLMAMMYGNGLAYYKDEELADGPAVKRAYVPQIEQWLKRNRTRHAWLLPQFLNYRHHFNCFSEMIFNKRKDYITGLFHLDGEFTRKSRQNRRTRRSEYLLHSADFGTTGFGNYLTQGRSAAVGRGSLHQAEAIPLIDWQREQQWLENMTGHKAAWHSYLRTPGTIYYATPPWVGLFRDKGWADAAAAVPEIIHAMQRNQIMLKYQILIPVSYFRARYQDWNNYDAEKREDLMDEVSGFIEDELADVENAYKSITTFFDTDQSGNEMGKIEIIAIDDKIKRDSWVPSSNAADAQIVQGLGLHPSQLGLAPEGGKMGAGSGSDQREAWNANINLNTLEQEIVLEPLNFISRFNGWGVTFFMDHTYHTTTNNQEDGLEPAATTITAT